MAYVEYIAGDKIRKHPLTQPGNIIGRGRKAQIRIRHDRKVSRIHCRILQRRDGYYLEHISPKNRTLLNGQTVMGDPEKLKDGDEITIGKHDFVFHRKDPSKRGLLAKLKAFFGR